MMAAEACWLGTSIIANCDNNEDDWKWWCGYDRGGVDN